MVVSPPYQPYLDTAPAPFRWRLGLRPLDLEAWLAVDEHYDAEVAEKRTIVDRFHSTVFRALPGDDVVAAAHEVYTAIATHLRHLDADRFGDVPIEAPDGLHPLDAAGRLVQEDLVVLVERDGALVCAGGSVCFPNRWHLAGKVGLTMAAIHEPVAHLNEQLGSPIDRALERLTPERSFWRLGYGLLDSDRLYQAVDGTAAPTPSGVAPADYFLRVERETLRRMPRTGCVLFTIHTYVNPVTDVPVDAAPRLADALDAMPPGVADYKKLAEVGPAIAAWLRERASR